MNKNKIVLTFYPIIGIKMSFLEDILEFKVVKLHFNSIA
jgi:hypothetical protein